MFQESIDAGRLKRGEHEYPTGNARLAKLRTLVRGRDTVAPGVHCFQRPGDGDRAETIGIGFDHWKERGGDQLLKTAGVASQGREIHIEPGPVRGGRI